MDYSRENFILRYLMPLESVKYLRACVSLPPSRRSICNIFRQAQKDLPHVRELGAQKNLKFCRICFHHLCN